MKIFKNRTCPKILNWRKRISELEQERTRLENELENKLKEKINNLELEIKKTEKELREGEQKLLQLEQKNSRRERKTFYLMVCIWAFFIIVGVVFQKKINQRKKKTVSGLEKRFGNNRI